jgi:drug/metabolite transporter (DMT)-like permease
VLSLPRRQDDPVDGQRLAPASVAVTVVLWAVAFPAIRVALESFGPLELSFVRIAVAAAVLLAVAPFAGVRRPRRHDLVAIAWCAFAGMAAYQVLLNVGEQSVPAGTASLLIATAPIYSVVISSRVLGEVIPRVRWLGLVVALLGTVAVAFSTGDGISVSGGALLIVAAAVAQGVYHVAQRPLLQSYSAVEVATYGMVAGAVMLLPAAPLAVSDVTSASASSVSAVVLLGVGPSAIGFVAWAAAVARLHVSRPAIALYAVPPIAIVVAWAALGERPDALAVVGGVISLAGVAIGTLALRARTPRAAPCREAIA